MVAPPENSPQRAAVNTATIGPAEKLFRNAEWRMAESGIQWMLGISGAGCDMRLFQHGRTDRTTTECIGQRSLVHVTWNLSAELEIYCAAPSLTAKVSLCT